MLFQGGAAWLRSEMWTEVRGQPYSCGGRAFQAQETANAKALGLDHGFKHPQAGEHDGCSRVSNGKGVGNRK